MTIDPSPAGLTITHALLTQAHSTALAVLDAGWQLRKVRYCTATGIAALDVYTPAHRGLTITSSQFLVPYCLCPTTDLVVRLTRQVAQLGQRDSDLVGDLTWMLCEQTRRYPPGPRRDPIPDPALHRQSLNLRTAFWLLATLVGGYQWQVQHLGEDIAAGGFWADIPDDVLAVFPAGMPADGTPAASLARIIPALAPADLTYLRRRSPAELSHAHGHAS